jgi:hypothetical protein
MQPATKLATLFLAGCLLASLFGGMLLYLSVHREGKPVEGKAESPQVSRPAPARQPSAAEETASAGGAAATGVALMLFFVLVFVVLPILYVVSVVLLLAWVAKDAKNRGIDGGAVWVIVLFFTHWIGLLVYLASRPSGHLVVCKRCHNKKLNYVLSCPHCGGA